MKKKLITTLAALVISTPAIGQAEGCEPSRWTITLEMLEPLSDEERQFVLNILGVDLSLEVIGQAIAEGQISLEVFGGE